MLQIFKVASDQTWNLSSSDVQAIMAAFMRIARQRKVYTPRRTCRDKNYRAMYRFEEENVVWMAEHFLVATGETRGGALSPKVQMEVFLRYIGDPGFQRGVGEDLGLDQSTVCKTFTNVLQQIVAKADTWIKFPDTPADIQIAKDMWHAKSRMPCAIGALDCTHVRIQKPGIHGDEYINRKGVASLNVQATCDAEERFTSVVAEWPGSVHDSRIWKNSDVGNFMTNSGTDALLLGDDGYGIAPWLMTPFGDPQTSQERTFNRIFTKERVIIERCFGQVKRRFPLLKEVVRLQLKKVPSVIAACMMLHNVGKYLHDDADFEENNLDDQQFDLHDGEDLNDMRLRIRGQQRRRELSVILHEQEH